MSRAVRESFVRLYEEGLIYRATRLVNWGVATAAPCSVDLEVENEEAQGELYEFAYPWRTRTPTAGGPSSSWPRRDRRRCWATRPSPCTRTTRATSTCTASTLQHPFLDRQIPIITDAILVDMAFGTGAVKVTPAHDFNDFATGKRHELEEINILNLDGTMNEQGGEFAGLSVKEARKAVKARARRARASSAGSKPHRLMLPRSQRSRHRGRADDLAPSGS